MLRMRNLQQRDISIGVTGFEATEAAVRFEGGDIVSGLTSEEWGAATIRLSDQADDLVNVVNS